MAKDSPATLSTQTKGPRGYIVRQNADVYEVRFGERVVSSHRDRVSAGIKAKDLNELVNAKAADQED